MLRLTDTHVHLDHPRIMPNLDVVLEDARQAGVFRMINIGHDFESSRASIKLAARYPQIWATVGIHPHSAKTWGESSARLLEEMLAESKVVALGEIGLDYHYDFSPRPVQQRVFRRQLELACKIGKPVIIHMREAAQDTLSILREYSPLPGGVMHCYSGSATLALELIELGLYIGLGGPITFTNARRSREVAAAIPANKLLLETDCPYLAPHPHRGITNHPALVTLVAEEVAKIKDMDSKGLAQITTYNANELFGLEE